MYTWRKMVSIHQRCLHEHLTFVFLVARWHWQGDYGTTNMGLFLDVLRAWEPQGSQRPDFLSRTVVTPPGADQHCSRLTRAFGLSVAAILMQADSQAPSSLLLQASTWGCCHQEIA